MPFQTSAWLQGLSHVATTGSQVQLALQANCTQPIETSVFPDVPGPLFLAELPLDPAQGSGFTWMCVPEIRLMVSLVIITQLNPLSCNCLSSVQWATVADHTRYRLCLCHFSFFSLTSSFLPFSLPIPNPLTITFPQPEADQACNIFALSSCSITNPTLNVPSRFSPSTQLPPSFVCLPWLLALLCTHTTIRIRTVLSGAFN